MQRVFAPIEGSIVLLSTEDAHHLSDVVRLKVGEELEDVWQGKPYLCRVSSLAPLRIDVIAPIAEKREPANKICLACSLLKGDKNDLIVEKGTELGVSLFLPFLSERTVVKASAEDNRLQRLKKIAKSSAQQCRRQIIPEVAPYQSFSQILSFHADRRILAYEAMLGQSETLGRLLDSLTSKETILFAVGPEGGFSPREAEEAEREGFSFISLGQRILRAETAALFGAALIGSKSDELALSDSVDNK